jgi:hypothetical protein
VVQELIAAAVELQKDPGFGQEDLGRDGLVMKSTAPEA